MSGQVEEHADARIGHDADRPPDSVGKSAPFEYSWVRRTNETRQASKQGTSVDLRAPPREWNPRQWLLARLRAIGASVATTQENESLAGAVASGYWRSAWGLAAMLMVVTVGWGTWLDRVAATGWVGATAIGFLLSKRTADTGIALHLVSAYPISLLYFELTRHSALAPSLPIAGSYGMLAFPGLVLVAFWGWRGMLAAALLGAASEGVLRLGGQPALASGMIPAMLIGGAVYSPLRYASRLERGLQRAILLDPLTGLANRRLLYQRARQWQQQQGGPAILLTIGLNRFNAINNILGRSAADELLPLVAGRLVEAAGPGTTVARLGGDEFVVFAPGLGGDVAPRRLAKQILTRLRDVFAVGGHAVHVSACIGIATYPEHGKDIDDLIRYADAAVQRAKQRGNSIDEISWHGSKRVSSAILLEGDLREAVIEEKLVVEFQPVLEVATRRIVGAEALVRWDHPELGRIGPSEFIPLAEAAGIVSTIDGLVARRALACREGWARSGWDGWVSVNLSAESFSHPDLVETLKQALAMVGTSASKLVVEVTESRAMRDPDASAAVLGELKRVGVGIALDDFGMGYSSLAYLKLFPVDHLKLDRTFVQGIGIDVRDEQLLEALIELAHRRGMAVVAEGVETQAQLCWLAERGCEHVQGFYIGHSLPDEAFAALVAAPHP